MLEVLGADRYALWDGWTVDSQDLDEVATMDRQAWEFAASTIFDGIHDVIVPEEIAYALSGGSIDSHAVAASIAGGPPHLQFIVTHRNAPPCRVGIADTDSEIRNVELARGKRIIARSGFDF